MTEEDVPSIACVLLEGEAQEGDLLPGNGVEQAVDDSTGESAPLILVHIDHLRPGRIYTTSL